MFRRFLSLFVPKRPTAIMMINAALDTEAPAERRGHGMAIVSAGEIVQANDWPDDYAESVEHVLGLLERHRDVDTLRILAAVLDARGSQFAASQVRRAIARIEQGA